MPWRPKGICYQFRNLFYDVNGNINFSTEQSLENKVYGGPLFLLVLPCVVSCSGEWKSMACKDSPHSRLGDLLGLRICSMASNAQGVVVRAHIRACKSSRRAQQTTEHTSAMPPLMGPAVSQLPEVIFQMSVRRLAGRHWPASIPRRSHFPHCCVLLFLKILCPGCCLDKFG